MVERSKGRPLFMIGVAAELAGLHPQTLRIYERRRLVMPQRSSGNTRLYSEADIERLRLIVRLSEEGINLAGVERILELQDEVEQMARHVLEMRRKIEMAESRMRAEAERIHRSYKAEIVHVRRGAIAPHVSESKDERRGR